MTLGQRGVTYLEGLPHINIPADKLSIIEDTASFREALFALIKSAKKRIYLTALYLQDDEAGQAVMEALYQAKQNNPELDIKVFVDYLRAQRGLMGHAESIGNVRLYREFAEKYTHSIEVLGVPVKTKEVLGVLHLKGFVVDDKLLYSGASINNIYLQQADRYRYDRYHLVESQRLTDSFVLFLQSYLAKSNAVKQLNDVGLPSKKQLKPSIKQLKKNLRVGDYLFKSDTKAVSAEEIALTPLIGFGGRKNPLNRTIYELIRTVQNEATIFTPYFNLPNNINRVVRRVLKKGKRVEIIIGDKTANDFYIPIDQEFNKIGIVPYVYETNLRQFVKRNQKYVDAGLLNIYLWRHEENSFHLKGLSCDDERYLLTGHNLNPRACKLDLENGIFLNDPHKNLKDQFAHEKKIILTHTKRISHFEDIEQIKDYPEAASKLMRSVKRAKLDSILNRLL